MPVPPQIDPRGPRLGAEVTTVVLALVLLAGSALGAGTVLFPTAVALALAAACSNAASGVCLGCALSLVIRRTTHREGAPA